MNKNLKPDRVKMGDCLEKLPEATINQGKNNEQLVLRALENYDRKIMSIFYDRKKRALVRDQLLAELKLGFEHRRKALNMILETRLQSAREACNHLLVTEKTKLRQEWLEFFGNMYQQVAGQLDALTTEFLNNVDQQFQRIEHYKTKCIKEREQKRLEKSVDDFLETVEQLLDEFRSIVSENIEHNKLS